MRNPGGYGIVFSPVPSALQFDGGRRREFMQAGTFETDTVTCGHCGGVTTVAPFRDAADDVGALCKKCMKVVCRHCVNNDRNALACDPVEAKLERWEKAR